MYIRKNSNSGLEFLFAGLVQFFFIETFSLIENSIFKSEEVTEILMKLIHYCILFSHCFACFSFFC